MHGTALVCVAREVRRAALASRLIVSHTGIGQVRGKDFRHEKTKKKRGGYRGGVLDIGTRSQKFVYDDDDE